MFFAKDRYLFVRHFAFGDVLLTTPFLRLIAGNNRKAKVDLYSMVGSIYQPLSGAGRFHRLQDCSLPEVSRRGYRDTYWFSYEFDRSLHILDGYALSSGLRLKDQTLSWRVLPEERQRGAALLEGVRRPVVGFLPVCASQTKSVSREKTQQLVDLLRERLNVTVALFADHPLDISGSLNLTDRFASIRDLAAVIEQCDVFLTIDTGPFHIAQALGVPTVGLFGCTLPELLATRPETLQMVRVETLPCLGCYHRIPKGEETVPECARGDRSCMEALDGDEVVQAVQRALERREDRRLAGRVEKYQDSREALLANYPGTPQEISAPYRAYVEGLSLAHEEARRNQPRQRKGKWKRLVKWW